MRYGRTTNQALLVGARNRVYGSYTYANAFDRVVYGRIISAPTNAVRLMFPDVILNEVTVNDGFVGLC